MLIGQFGEIGQFVGTVQANSRIRRNGYFGLTEDCNEKSLASGVRIDRTIIPPTDGEFFCYFKANDVLPLLFWFYFFEIARYKETGMNSGSVANRTGEGMIQTTYN